MKQSILKRGDLVKCIGLTQALSDSGFQIDGLYEVKEYVDGALCLGVETPKGRIDLVSDGALTDHADDFAKHTCPVVLPRGV